MPTLKRTLTSSDFEDHHPSNNNNNNNDDDDNSDSASTSSLLSGSSLEWEAASLSSNHRRYRSGSQPDFGPVATVSAAWRTALQRTWTELGLILKLVLFMVTPFAARQLGSMVSRRLWARHFGAIHFH